MHAITSSIEVCNDHKFQWLLNSSLAFALCSKQQFHYLDKEEKKNNKTEVQECSEKLCKGMEKVNKTHWNLFFFTFKKSSLDAHIHMEREPEAMIITADIFSFFYSSFIQLKNLPVRCAPERESDRSAYLCVDENICSPSLSLVCLESDSF